MLTSQAICNSYTPLTNPLFANLTVTSSQFLSTDNFAQKNNIRMLILQIVPINSVYNIYDDVATMACANATLHMLVKLASPDLTLSTRISNVTFIASNNSLRDFVVEVSELSIVVTKRSSNPIQVRQVKSDNFSYAFNSTAVSASISGIIPVQNNDWDLILNKTSVMIFQIKLVQNISSLRNSKFVIKLQVLAGVATGLEEQTIGNIKSSGAEINFNNNAVVRILNIEN